VRATCQGAPLNIAYLPVLLNITTARAGAVLLLPLLRQVVCL
jgi:hypothetical protein